MHFTGATDHYRLTLSNCSFFFVCVRQHEVVLIHPPRKGQRLLVLDLDYTLFDLKGASISTVCSNTTHAHTYTHSHTPIWTDIISFHITDILVTPLCALCFVFCCAWCQTFAARSCTNFLYVSRSLNFILLGVIVFSC